MITPWHPSGMMPLACVQVQYIFYSIIQSALCRETVLYCLPCYIAVYTLLSVLSCAAVLFFFFIWPLKATPSNRIWPCFDRCLFCFVFLLFFHPLDNGLSFMSQNDSTQLGALWLPTSGVCAQDSLLSTSTSSFTPTATTSSPPTLKSPSIVNPSSTMVQDTAKSVCEAVIQSLTPLMVHVSLQSGSGSVSSLVQMPPYRGLWLLL